MSELQIESLRREAKQLQRAYRDKLPWAVERIAQYDLQRAPDALQYSDFLHVVARGYGYLSWPKLKAAVEIMGLDRAQKLQRLRVAVFYGQTSVAERLLQDTPDLPHGQFCMQVALLDRVATEKALQDDPALATTEDGPRRPILHLAFSRWIKARPDLEADMIAIADMLLANGADVNDSFPHEPGSDHRLSALYGAIGHADNMALGKWLLDNGAEPNDGESLYHSTELDHHEGLRLLLQAGADPRGTNALLRAMDFQDHTAVELLLKHGARADDFNEADVGGEPPWTVPALHQAARRGCDRRMADILLDAGADPNRIYKGAGAYAFARVHGNRDVAAAIKDRGGAVSLSPPETVLARAMEGEPPDGAFVDPDKLPAAYRHILRETLHLPGALPGLKQLVAVGMPYDEPDEMGLTPVQIAGWEGLPEVMDYFLSLKPDLSHVNGYGGTLLSTIVHGSENAPDADTRDHIACLQRALHEGVALPRQTVTFAGRDDVRAFLEDWAESYPGQVV